MKIIILLALITLSLNSQWINNVGYSTSKEKFENSEWRIYEGELQVHRNDSSFFYDIEKLKLNDKLKVVADTLITERGKFQLFDSKFDKVNYWITKNHIKIYNEKTSDSIFELNLGDELQYLNFKEEIYFPTEDYYIFKSKNKIYFVNNNNYAQMILTRSRFPHFVNKLILISYDIIDHSFDIKQIYNEYSLEIIKINQVKYKNLESPKFYYSTEVGYFDWNSEYFISTRDYIKYDTNNDSFELILKNKDYVGNILSINKNDEYNVTYNNYIFNSRELKNWGNQVIDTNIRKYKARLIQEIIPNTYLMYSDSINYFIYNLIDNNLVVMDKLNDIHKKVQFSNEFVVTDSKLFYAETASHQIARVSISSIIDNLISVDFSADKNMADSNHVFTFENKSFGEIDEYLWDFGDGNISTEKNPKHKYVSSGTYDITLTCSGAGQSTSNSKKGHIYIPTPVRLNVGYTMTLNENDATFHVSSGATGSRLKYRLQTNPYHDIFYTDGIGNDTLEASGYSFTTNKSYFTRYFLFEVWNEMYSAHQYYNINDVEFDFWNKDVVEEKIIENKNSNINLNSGVNNNFMLYNSINEPITVIEKNGYIHIDNMIDKNKYYEINKEIELYSDYSFITKDNILYLVNLENNKNKLDSVDLNLIIGDDKIELYDNLDEFNYALVSNTTIYIIDVKGNLIHKFNRPEEEPVFLKRINNEYYYGDKYYNKNDPSLHTVFRIIIFDDKFERKYAVRSLQNFYSSNILKTFLYKENNHINMIRIDNLKSNVNVYSYSIDLENNNKVTSKYNNYTNKPYYYFYNNKLVSLNELIYYDIFNGNFIHYYTNLSVIGISDSNEIYNYKFNERLGIMNSALFANDYLYLFGLNYKGQGLQKVLWKLDLKDEMLLNVEENIIEENRKYLWDYKLILNNKYNNLSEINLIDLMGNMVDKSNYSLQLNNDKIILKAINLSNGIYNLQLNNENIILLKY